MQVAVVQFDAVRARSRRFRLDGCSTFAPPRPVKEFMSRQFDSASNSHPVSPQRSTAFSTSEPSANPALPRQCVRRVPLQGRSPTTSEPAVHRAVDNVAPASHPGPACRTLCHFGCKHSASAKRDGDRVRRSCSCWAAVAAPHRSVGVSAAQTVLGSPFGRRTLRGRSRRRC